MYQPKVYITISEPTAKRLLEAFDNTINLCGELQDIIKYFIEREKEEYVIIPFCVEEVYDPEDTYKFYINEDGNVSYSRVVEETNPYDCTDDITQFPDSMLRAVLDIAKKYNREPSNDINERISGLKAKYEAQIHEFESLFKIIIREQKNKYVDLDANLDFSDEPTTLRYTLNAKDEVVYFKLDEIELYEKEGKCKPLSDAYELCPLSALMGMMYTMECDFDKKIELPFL